MKEKKLVHIGFTILIVLISLVGCKKRNYFVDQEPESPSLSKAQIAFADQVFFRVYNINKNNDPFKIPFGFTNFSDKDRYIIVEYSTTPTAQIKGRGLRGTHYTASDTILIPAGKLIDSLSLVGNYDLFPSPTDIDTIKLKIKSPSTLIKMDTLMLALQRYCDVIIKDLMGKYPRTRERNFGRSYFRNQQGVENIYQTIVDSLQLLTPTTASGIIINLFNEDWNNIKFFMNWTDPNNFRLTIPLQPTGSATPIKWIRGAINPGAPKSFTSCVQTFTVSLDLLNFKQEIVPTDSIPGLNPEGFEINLRR
jgi:hypothetical protein